MLLIKYSTLELVSSWATPRTQEEKEHQSHKHQACPVGWRGCVGKIWEPTQGWNACAPFTSASQGQLRNGPGNTENSSLSSPASKRLVVRRESEGRVGIKDKERGAFLCTVRDIALYYLQWKSSVHWLLLGAFWRVRRLATLTVCTESCAQFC